uniref:Uncharacterized protein n=2 Tax=Caenorhabditis japonica TaxID=281687 RepID=A0A8R1IA35_CAEJA
MMKAPRMTDAHKAKKLEFVKKNLSTKWYTGILACRVYKNGTQYNAVQDLKSALLRERDAISVAELQKLVGPNQMFEVIQNHGGETSY